MVYDGPRDSFVQNAKLALKLADTEAQFWAELPQHQHSIIAGSTGRARKASVGAANSVGDIARAPTPRKYGTFYTFTSAPDSEAFIFIRPYLTFVEAPAFSLKAERKSHVAAAGTAARLFIRRSLYVSLLWIRHSSTITFAFLIATA
jgi:hypothetical protein